MLAFAIRIAVIFSSQTTFLFILMPQYLSSSGIEIYKISYLFGLTKFVKILSTFPFGYMFDKKPKLTLFISILLKFIATILLFFVSIEKNLITIIVAILIGLSQGAIFIKTDTFVYNYLKDINKVDLFPKYISVYYLLSNIIYTAIIFSSGIILGKSNYNIIFILSSIIIILSGIALHFTPNYKIERNRANIKDIKNLINQNNLLKMLVSLSILKAIVWQIPKLISIIIQKHNNIDMSMTNILSLLNLAIIIGCSISMIRIIKDVKKIVKIILFLIGSLILSALIFDSMFKIIIPVIIINLVYSTLEVSLERKIDIALPQNTRGTFFSISVIIMTLIQMFIFFIFGKLLENNIDYSITLSIILVPIFLFYLFFYKTINKKLSFYF